MRRVLLVFLAACVGPASGATRTIPMARVVESLVADLGDDVYQVRERATAALRRIGYAARQPLEAAARSDDPEIRIRARDILRDITLGVTPEWPAELVLLARHFDQQPRHTRYDALRRIGAIGTPAVPFLVSRLAKGEPNDANYALNFIQSMTDPRVPELIISLIKEPDNDYLTQALAWAQARRGDTVSALGAIVEKRLPPELLKKAADPAIGRLTAKLKTSPREAAQAAAAAAAAHPDDLRPLYVQALALLALDQPEKAAEARQRALKSLPGKPEAHYLAARMLTELGRYRFAVPEWQKIMDAPPEDSPLDVAAHLALNRIYSENGLYEMAADHLGKAVGKAAKLDPQNPIPQTIVQSIHAELSRLRSYGAKYPQEGIVVEDRIPEKEVGVEVAIEAQDGTTDELRAALATASLHLELRAGSPPMRLLDVASVSFRYDRQKKALDILLGEKPACEPVPFEAPKEKARFAVHCGDAAYLFRISPDGTCEQLARYTKNYRLKITLGPRLRICTGHAVALGGKTYEWEKARAGIPLDTLPRRLVLAIQATSPAGPRITVRRTLEFSEPDLVADFLKTPDDRAAKARVPSK